MSEVSITPGYSQATSLSINPISTGSQGTSTNLGYSEVSFTPGTSWYGDWQWNPVQSDWYSALQLDGNRKYATQADAEAALNSIKQKDKYKVIQNNEGQYIITDLDGNPLKSALAKSGKTAEETAIREGEEDYQAWTQYAKDHWDDDSLSGYFSGLYNSNNKGLTIQADGSFLGSPGIFQVDENGKYILDENGNPKKITTEYLESIKDNPNLARLYRVKEGDSATDPLAVYNYLRNDQQDGYYHWTPGRTRSRYSIPPQQRVPRKPPEIFKKEYKPQPWTDWIHLTTNAANDLANNARQYNLDMQKIVALKEPIFKNAKVTNAYAERTLRGKQISELRARAKQNLGSDLDANQDYLNNVEKQAADLEGQNILSKFNEFNTTLQRVQEIANDNTKESVDVANENRQSLAALHNQRIADKQKYLLNRTALQDDSVNKLDASHKKWLHDERTNKYMFDENVANARYNATVRDAYDKWAKTQNLGSSNTFNRWFNTLWGSQIVLEGLDSNSYNNRQAVLDWIAAHQDSQIVKDLNATFAKEKEQADIAYQQAKNHAATDYAAVLGEQPYYISGEGTWYNPRSTVNPLYQAEGGVATAVLDHRKAHENLDKNVQENSRMLERRLARAIGALDRETLVYLKALFK